MTPESCNLPICWGEFAEHVPVATRKAPLLDSAELLEHVSTATDLTEEELHTVT
jgi:hypothetical protein